MPLSNLAKFIIAAIIVAVSLFLVFPGNQQKAVINLLEKGHDAIEAGNVDAVMKRISLSYHDDLGFNYGAVRGSFGYTFSIFKNIKVDYKVISIKTGKDTCIAEIKVWAHGFWTIANQEANIDGTKNEYEPVSILCRKESGRWRVISSRWPNRKDSLKMFSMKF